jgi:hypothetical protein
MEFEQPELGQALRELAIERDPSFATRRRAYVDYDGTGAIQRINWPQELGEPPDAAARETRVLAIRGTRPPPPRQRT